MWRPLSTLVGAAFLALCLAGCKGPVLKELAWEPYPSYAPPHIEEIVAHPPATLLQGEAAPWDGVLVDADDLNGLVGEHQRLIDALQTAYAGRTQDRDYADKALQSAQDALVVCRKNQPRTFLAGVALGGGACGLAVGMGAAALSRLP